MENLKSWQQFKEANIYGGDWATNTTQDPDEVQPEIQPENKGGDFKYYFKVPVSVESAINLDNIIGYAGDIDDLVNNLFDNGIDAYWLKEQFETWKDNLEDEMSEEPDEDDYNEDDMDSYQSDYEEWNNKYEEFNKKDFSELLDDYASDEFGNWDKFLDELKSSSNGRINNVISGRDSVYIYSVLADEFNQLLEYFDEAKELGIVKMEVIGDDFLDSKFTVLVESTKELSDDELKIVKDYIEGQCSDGIGEGFEQHEVEGYYVHTWWSNRDETNDYGEYEIEIEKV